VRGRRGRCRAARHRQGGEGGCRLPKVHAPDPTRGGLKADDGEALLLSAVSARSGYLGVVYVIRGISVIARAQKLN
jgi:hypothetical protein